MTPKKIVDRVAGRLLSRTDSDLRDKVYEELDNVLHEVEEGVFLPWFLFTDTDPDTFILSAGDSSIDLPADFLREQEQGIIRLRDNSTSKWKAEPKKVELDIINNRMKPEDGTVPTGIPGRYTLWGDKLYFDTEADRELGIWMPYIKADAKPNGPEDEGSYLWLENASQYILALTLHYTAENRVVNPRISKQAFQASRHHRRELFRAHEARLHTNMEYTLGEGNVS